MVDVARREDALVDKISDLLHRRNEALSWVKLMVLSDLLDPAMALAFEDILIGDGIGAEHVEDTKTIER